MNCLNNGSINMNKLFTAFFGLCVAVSAAGCFSDDLVKPKTNCCHAHCKGVKGACVCGEKCSVDGDCVCKGCACVLPKVK